MKFKNVKEQIDKYFDNVNSEHLLNLYNNYQKRKEKVFQLKFYKDRLHLYKPSIKVIREKQIEILQKEIKELS